MHNYFVRLQNILELSLRNESVVNNKKPLKMQYAFKTQNICRIFSGTLVEVEF